MYSFENLTMKYGEKTLFNSISAIIKPHDRIGLIGVNGTGKSTLLKVLAGIEQAGAGRLDHPQAYRIEYLAQNPELTSNMSVLDYIYYGDSDVMIALRAYETALYELEVDSKSEANQAGLLKAQQQMDLHNAWDANTLAKTILTKLGVSQFDLAMNELSGGQKKRVAIAKALIQPADLLILDEPTNHLDNETIMWLEKHLVSYPGALLLVTHDRYFLDRVTQTIYELDSHNLYVYEGNYAYYLEEKLKREALEREDELKHANTLKRELAWLSRGARARSTKQKARIERIDDLKDKTFKGEEQDIEIQTQMTRLGKKVIELKNVSKSYEDKQLFKDVNLLIKPEARIGIIGPNGAGKSTLLNCLSQNDTFDQGELIIGPTVKIGYYKQEEEAFDEDMRIIDVIKNVSELIETVDNEVITAGQMLERFLFTKHQQWAQVKSLSGGERRRLYLLKILMEKPNVLLLDEPTNDLDIKTLGILEAYLDQFGGVLVTVSHDRYFLDQVVDELLVFDRAGNVRHFYGNHSDYLEKHTEISQTKQAVKQEKQKNKKDKKLSYNEQKEWETIEGKIGVLETEIEAIKKLISEAGSHYEEVERLFSKQKEEEDKLEAMYLRWEELSVKVESLN